MDKYTKLCPRCGSTFRDSKHPNKTYCSRKCQLADCVDTRLCIGCGKAFEIKRSKPQKYCSQACGAAHRTKPEIKARKTCICEFCGVDFETWNSRPGRFCSRLCAGRYGAKQLRPSRRKLENLRTIYCEICNREYVVHVAQLTGRNSRFCSVKCRAVWKSESMKGAGNHNYIGGTRFPDRGSSWSKQRKLAKARDGARCQICGTADKKRRISVHHIIPYKQFGGDHLKANVLSNLITLCQKCHVKVERHKLPCPRPLL
jgi:hypothetical protein